VWFLAFAALGLAILLSYAEAWVVRDAVDDVEAKHREPATVRRFLLVRELRLLLLAVALVPGIRTGGWMSILLAVPAALLLGAFALNAAAIARLPAR
jgi:hypothetical protein